MLPIIEKILRTLPKGSWCPEHKAISMAEAIIYGKPQVAVEIGVFGGDTLFVIAQAMQHVGAGKVWGIDPWTNADAVEGMAAGGPNFEWWSTLNLESIYGTAKMKRGALKLTDWCELVRARSDDPDALSLFPDNSVGFFHLDGNHGKDQCLKDCQLWLPKLASGCPIFFDDASWVEAGQLTTVVGMEYLLANGCEIAEPMIHDCAILRKG